MYPGNAYWPALYADMTDALLSGLAELAKTPGLSVVFSEWYLDRIRKTVACSKLCFDKHCVLLLGEDQVVPVDAPGNLGPVSLCQLNKLFLDAGTGGSTNPSLRNGLVMAMQLVECTRRNAQYYSQRLALVQNPTKRPVPLFRFARAVDEISCHISSSISRYNEPGFQRSLYVAGPPGVGKTTWVTWCVEQAVMKTNWDSGQIQPVFLRICCATETLTLDRIQAELRRRGVLGSQDDLPMALCNSKKKGTKLFVFLLLDELDMLGVSSKRPPPAILRSLLQWTCSTRKADCMRFLLLATGNTFDLPELYSSQMKRVLMPACNWEELEEILTKKKASDACAFKPEAISFIAKIVANQGGDTRKALALMENSLPWDHELGGDNPLVDIPKVRKTMILYSESAKTGFGLLATLPKFLVLVITCLTKTALCGECATGDWNEYLGVDCWKIKKLYEVVLSSHYSEEASVCVDELFTMPFDCGVIDYASGSDGKCPEPTETIILRWSVETIEKQLDDELSIFYNRAKRIRDELVREWNRN